MHNFVSQSLKYFLALMLGLSASYALADEARSGNDSGDGIDKNTIVLNSMQLGLDALISNDWQLAKKRFDVAIAGIETVFLGSDDAEKARSLWYSEGKKAFKGEPYERAMTYFYRGLIDLMEGDADNARAMFQTGLLQDAFAEEHQYRSDFALLMYMSAWAESLMNNESLFSESVNELREIKPDLVPPSLNDNVLLIVETGSAPKKLADGVGQYELVYRRGGDNLHNTASYEQGNQKRPLHVIEDLYWQASTRGGRQIDRIVKGKVEFRDKLVTSGEVITGVSKAGMILSRQSALRDKFGVFGLIGVAQIAVGANVETQIDTRYWNNLPELLFVATTRIEAGDDVSVDIDVAFDGIDIGTPTSEMKIYFTDSGHGIGWLRI